MTMTIPEISLGDRMRIALRHSGISVSEIAEQLELERATPSRWINGRTKPRRSDLMAWSQITQVPLSWLLEGDVRPKGFEPPTF